MPEGDLERILHGLSQAKVRYLVVGGVAVVLYQEFADQAKREQWVAEKGLAVFTLWSSQMPATEVDIFVREPLPFEEMEARARTINIAGALVRVASIDDLIEMKRKVGRAKDLEDIAELEAIARLEKTDG
ncbi:MAG: hypothetical protein HYZ28_28460 [Myxococcales bacterium]|nr:hypothetical protein [Myxococcales bacterium]